MEKLHDQLSYVETLYTVFIPISAQGTQINYLGGCLFVSLFVARIDQKMDDFGGF